MRRWIALVARLYPRFWRDRYGDEFALVAEVGAEDCRRGVRPQSPIDTISQTSFTISCTMPDPVRAQLVVRRIITALVEGEVIEHRRYVSGRGGVFQNMADHKIGENLMVVAPASFPGRPDGPGWLAIVAAGLGIGFVIGIATLAYRLRCNPTAA
jgi:hypothetical protein